ncbi:rod shape-determining protein MreD, partial [Acinetobacter baumannii]
MPIAKLKREKRKDPLWGIILSIIVGSVLMIYPLSYDISGWRPLFMLMIMLFWVV